MSFIYSQALVEELLAGSCSDTDPSALLSGNLTHKLSLSHDKTMDSSRLSRFGMTCKPLTAGRGAELLMLWLAGFHAKTFPLLEKAQELTANDQECGATWRGWLAKFDPVSCLWKTAQHSLIEDLAESLATFPRSGMTRGGLLWELPMLERPTRETGCGYWPTPVCMDSVMDRMMGGATVYMDRFGKPRRKTKNGSASMGLSRLVQYWPTPTAHNAKETNAPSESERNTPTLAAQAGGSLNPSWVEWLMGWPIGHTALKPLETDRCLNVQQQPGLLLEGQFDA